VAAATLQSGERPGDGVVVSDAATPTVTTDIVAADQPKSPALPSAETSEATASRDVSTDELKRLDLEASQAFRDGRMDLVREKMDELRRQVERLKQARANPVPDAENPPLNRPAPENPAVAAPPVTSAASGTSGASLESTLKAVPRSGVLAAADSPVTEKPPREEPAPVPAPVKISVVATAVTPVSVLDTPSDASKVETPSSVPSPASTTSGTPSITRASPELVASLLRRGDTMLQQGDVLSARLFFERAAAVGSGQGAISAGRTYDPNYLATTEALGLKADVARARAWYRTASVLGDRDADGLLKALGP
jgi:hypothetical protein